jgi:hypothetical protein
VSCSSSIKEKEYSMYPCELLNEKDALLAFIYLNLVYLESELRPSIQVDNIGLTLKPIDDFKKLNSMKPNLVRLLMNLVQHLIKSMVL